MFPCSFACPLGGVGFGRTCRCDGCYTGGFCVSWSLEGSRPGKETAGCQQQISRLDNASGHRSRPPFTLSEWGPPAWHQNVEAGASTSKWDTLNGPNVSSPFGLAHSGAGV